MENITRVKPTRLQLNVCLPRALWARMRQRDDINWQAVCRNAIEVVLGDAKRLEGQPGEAEEPDNAAAP